MESLTEAKTSREIESIVGTWEFHSVYDNGADGTGSIFFYNDGVVLTAGFQGKWFVLDKKAVFFFQFPDPEHVPPPLGPHWMNIYSSEISSDGKISGIQGWGQTSGHPKGTHSAKKRSNDVPARGDRKESPELVALLGFLK